LSFISILVGQDQIIYNSIDYERAHMILCQLSFSLAIFSE